MREREQAQFSGVAEKLIAGAIIVGCAVVLFGLLAGIVKLWEMLAP
jgi:hypothetical protein